MCFLLACTHHCFACVALLAVSGLLVVSNGVNFPHLERGEETMEEVSECVCVGHSDLSLSLISLSLISFSPPHSSSSSSSSSQELQKTFPKQFVAVPFEGDQDLHRKLQDDSNRKLVSAAYACSCSNGTAFHV